MPSFDNTKVAFERLSNRDLLRAKWLFSLFNYKWLIKYGPGLASWSLKIGLPIKGLLRKTIFNHFCGGESISDCDKTVESLYARRVGAILDYSVEGVEDEESFDYNCEEIKRTIDKAADSDAYPFAVFKTTGIGKISIIEKVSQGEALEAEEADAFQRTKKRFESICERASEKRVPLFIDAEESWIQDCIDDLAKLMMIKYNKHEVIIFNTVQLYRKNRLPFMEDAYADGRKHSYKVGFKLVRGAYMEKERARAKEEGYPSPIQDTKADSDKDFDAAIALCVANKDITKVCVGTHNETSSQLLVDLLEKEGISKDDDRFWFAQLYGMSDNISFNLADAGYKVAKYLPYGPVKSVLPYLSRRAEENTSVAGQSGREISLVIKELKRRKVEV